MNHRTHPTPPLPRSVGILVPANLLDFGPYAVAVYAAMRAISWNEGEFFQVSQAEIAGAAQISESKAKSTLNLLREYRWIDWKPQTSIDGGRLANLYWFCR